MGRYRHISTFSPHDSNTIDDKTGFKTKLSKMMRTWEGWFTSEEAWYIRNPQDFPIVPQKQLVYSDSRSEQANPSEDAQPPITPI